MNLGTLLEERASREKNRNFLYFEGYQLSYWEFFQRVKALASGLIELGLEPGDRVGFILGNCPEFLESFYAVIYAGGVAVPLNSQWKAGELYYPLQNSGARFVIFSEDQAKKILSMDKEGLELEKFITTGKKHSPDWLSYNEIFSDKEIDCQVKNENDLAGLIYTSGTTGKPRGVMLTHKNYLANVSQINSVLEIYETDRVLGILPPFHVLGQMTLLIHPVYSGSSLVLLGEFSPRKLISALKDYQITIFSGVPTVYAILNNLPYVEDVSFPHLRFATCGGAPLSVEVLEKFEKKYKVEILEGYGLSEATCACTLNPPGGKRKPGSVGPALPGVKIKIVDAQGKELETGEVGEIWVSGENVMPGYFQNPRETQEVLKDGWLNTGDLGYCDHDGYFYIKGRKKELIIRGGENIYPREIEEVLLAHPGVEEVAVIGIPDRIWGEEVGAFIVPKKGVELKISELNEFCHKYLADYKCPKLWKIIPELPRSGTGEILKQKVFEKYWLGAG